MITYKSLISFMFLAIVEVTLNAKALTFTVTDPKGKILEKQQKNETLDITLLHLQQATIKSV